MNSFRGEPRSQDPQLAREQKLFTTFACALALIGVLAVWVALSWEDETSRQADDYHSERSGLSPTGGSRDRWLADFELVERSGRCVSRVDLGNQYLVLNLVFSSCSMGCQEVNRRMSEIQTGIGTNTDVRLISISIDPRTDTPEALARFARGFHADTNQWLFLTGPQNGDLRFAGAEFLPGPDG